MTKIITQDAATEMAGHLRSNYPIDRAEVANFIEAMAAQIPASPGVALIAAERQRQIDAEGWTPEHDHEHTEYQLVQAAACYAQIAGADDLTRQRKIQEFRTPDDWPVDWNKGHWKPYTRTLDATRAGALCAAELDRRHRDGQI